MFSSLDQGRIAYLALVMRFEYTALFLIFPDKQIGYNSPVESVSRYYQRRWQAKEIRSWE
jgi:hypothetical protein